jgi:NitT/TauT family transport system ATP-binding protein
MASLEIAEFSWLYPLPTSFRLEVKHLVVEQNVAIYVTGPSGCGKSTLLGLLAGTIDSPLTVSREAVFARVAYVMHQSTLAPWLRLAQNVRLEARLRRCAADDALLTQLLDAFGLDWHELANKFPRQLSFGMRQRFEIAKALAFHPRLVLLDEGFSGIDGATRDRVIATVGDTLSRLEVTTIFTSHNLVDGLRLADRIVRVNDGIVSPTVPLFSKRSERAHLPADRLLGSQDAALLVQA